MKHDTPRRGLFSAGGRRLLLVLCVTALSLSGIVSRGVPEVFAIASTTLGVTSASGTYGGTTNLSASLASSGTPIAGESIDFHLGATDLGTIATDVNGNAFINNVSVSGITAGTYTGDITASFAGDANFAPSSGANDLIVTPAPLTITADDQGKVYGDPLPPLTVSYAGFVNGDSPASLTLPPTLTTPVTTASHVGAYAITASGAADPNYNISYVSGSLSVLPAWLGITADNQTKVYGDALPPLTVTYAGFVNGDTTASLTTLPTLTTPATAASHVGAYAITPSGAVASDYFMFYTDGSLSVTPAPLTIFADYQTKVYGAALPTLTASYAGFVNGDTSASLTTPPTLVTSATAASHVAGSPYAITASGAADPDYDITDVDGSLSVTPALLEVAPDNQTKLYGAALPTLTASYTGFVNGDTSANLATQPSISTSATAASHVAGNPYVLIASGAVDPDYLIGFIPGTLSISPAPLTITANNQTKVQGYPLPTLTAGYSGFVNGDTSTNLTTQPTLGTTATASSSAAGSPYAITASGAADLDYTIAYVAGALTVTAAPVVPPIPTTPTTYPTATATPIATTSPAPTSTSVPTSTPVAQASPISAPASPTAIVPPTVAPRSTTASLQFKGGSFTLSVDAGTITPGQTLTLKAVASRNPAISSSFGTVTFKDGATVLGTSKLVSGTARLQTNKLSSGVHDLTASLNGKTGTAIGVTPPVYVVVETKGVVIPVLVLHNLSRTVLGGRTLACELDQNSISLVQEGCEIITSDWLAGAKVTYTVTYSDGTTLIFTNQADGHGHSKALFNVVYQPAAVTTRLAREKVLVTVQAVLPNGITAGRTFVRFAVQR
ncbi:MAG TPA: MBG domain-containing protein [Chloroflexota bacterium]|nr:MBG domain-containing protein [Chloroflexota bacterium]